MKARVKIHDTTRIKAVADFYGITLSEALEKVIDDAYDQVRSMQLETKKKPKGEI